MELEQAYRRVEERLDRIDFPGLIRGFYRFSFALYDDAKAYTGGASIDKPANFIGNTSVQYNGAHTAIWYLPDEPADYDVLASKIVHEMLHAFQNASGEKRWADERAALVKYRYDEDNLSARLAEAECMRECLTGDAPEAFARLLSLRKARMTRFPFEYDYEARIEQIEGTAQYVELAALAQLDAAKAERRREELLSELADPSRYFPVRSVTYLSGAAMIACLRRYTDFDTDRFTDIPFATAAAEQAQPCDLPACDSRVTACLADWRKQQREIVDRALESGEPVLDGEYRLFAWNVYDGTWDGRYALLTAFIGYVEGTEKMPETNEELFTVMKMLNGNFVAEVDGDLRMTRVWRQQG